MLRFGVLRCSKSFVLRSRFKSPSLSLLQRSTILSSSSVRFNSTTTTSTDAASEIKDKLVSFSDEVSNAQSAEVTTHLHSDQLGYLQSIGLGEGWGPTSIVENLLEVCHVYTGLPWWGTIAAVTIAVRVVIFPLYVKASSNATKMSKIKPQLDEIMRDLKDEANESMQDKMRLMEKRKRLMKENDVSTMASFAPLVQVPLAYGFFQALRKMANYPVEGFQDQGILWFPDLSAVDPYLGLQTIAALAVIIVVRMGGETGQHAMAKSMKQVMTVVPLASILITKGFSVAVVLYFAINSILSLVQSLMFKNATMRRVLGMPKKFTTHELNDQARLSKTDTSIKDVFSNFLEDSKKNTLKKARDMEKKMEITAKRKNSEYDGYIKKRR
ncbi:hypothetical protein KGF56_000583 [Candida oxycetoniae]|uniref:Membrane insertase YidC/Oxa/ALB C-terminal domain-containing protein n=1 Tax=Candida oxycetoniae TaxID=497107 RepID=A0AAI9T124_9ASCO|nr:uncharacterized protein KGF56_000583 [Candida oxycetoniae]KAI3406452.1 hypothetical protein KGF56_000583 [Candida oxycetoniae]